MAPQAETICDGLDDDLDGQTDEIELSVEGLVVLFDGQTAVFPDQAVIEVTDGAGELVGGRTYTGNELRGAALEVEGDTVRIRLVADDSEDGLYGYAVASIVDQTGRLAPAHLALPASEHPHATPIDDEQLFVMPDSLGMGGLCGTDVGPCEYGRRRCVGEGPICVGGIKPGDEVCNDVDDDCDGEVDGEAELTDRPECPLDEGVCAGKSPGCDGGQYAVCNSLVYGPDVFEPDEAACDCLDNDCDGEVDEQGCDIDALAAVPETRARHCVLRGASDANADHYRFGGLEILEGASLTRPADSQCGVRGSGGGGHGGGCLTLEADQIIVAGSIQANGANAACQFSCGGGSAGDVVLLADQVVVAATGLIRADGGVGKRVSNETGGSGAGGSVRIRAQQIEIDGELRCRGGPAHDGGGAGGGAGGRGGSGRQPGAGGLTGGVRDGVGGEPDPDRPLEILGHVALGEGALLLSQRGDLTPDGHVRLVGAALAVQESIAAAVSLQLTPLAIRVTDADGQPLPDLTVSVRQQARAEVALEATTGTDGWAQGEVDPPLALDLPASIELVAADAGVLVGASVTWTYGDPAGRGECTVRRPVEGDPLAAQAPPTTDCEPP